MDFNPLLSLLNFDAQIVPSLVSRSFSKLATVPVTLTCTQEVQAYSPSPSPDSAILLRVPGSFQWVVILEPNIWKLGVPIVTEVSLLMSFQRTDWGK